jgi:subtilisin-like proprotein convertase family protein
MLSRTSLVAAFTALSLFSVPASALTFAGGSGFTIPDDIASGASSSIVVGTSGTISSFNSLTIFNFQHTFIGDLVATLSNGTTTIDILDRVGKTEASFVGSGGDLSGDFVFNLTGTAFPTSGNVSGGSGPFQTFVNLTEGSSSANGSFSDFNGSNVAGTWTLTIADRFGGDIGSIGGWEFDVTLASSDNSRVPESGSTLGLLGAMMVAMAGYAKMRRGM